MPCQQGRWQFVVGKMNSLLTVLTLINLIQPGALHLLHDALLVEHMDLLDIVRGTPTPHPPPPGPHSLSLSHTYTLTPTHAPH